MAWLRALDADLFHFVNLNLRHPALDGVMRFLSGNAIFAPVLIILGISLLWKGGVRARVMVLMLAIILPLGDGCITNPLKRAIGRERPFDGLKDAHVVGAKSDGRSMPSAHAATWFAAALIAAVYYRRSWRFMLPLACAVAFSRLYVGAHYPSDVIVGAVVGTAYAGAGMLGLNALWQWMGRKWFPLWWRRLPRLLNPDLRIETQEPAPAVTVDQHWVRLGGLLVGAVFLGRLIFLASGTIELSKDEAYQWLWSKHLALSYYSKPPMIACAQWLSTSVFGDTSFGVRVLSPVIGAVLLLLLLFWIARMADGRTAFWLMLILLATPLLAVGSTLLTIDPLLVMFWTVAMVLGWRAVQRESTVWHWLGVGLAMGLAFLSKYSALYQVVCWALFFALWPPARPQLRKPGPWLALLVMLACTTPVVVWNMQHHGVTLSHLSENAGLHEQWQRPLRHLGDFTGAEFGLLNPVFFVASLWALVAFWKEKLESPVNASQPSTATSFAERRGFMIFLFCMGAPVFLGHWLYTLHSQVQPNWIAPAIVPMFCLMVFYWERRWREGARGVIAWLCTGLALGLIVAVVLHEPRLVEKLVGQQLPPDKDPLRRVRGWKATADVIEGARQKLLAEGKPTFVILDHYGITGLLTFYLPDAAPRPGTLPLVYSISEPTPQNQFYFWPEYRYKDLRKGGNAIFVVEMDQPQTPMIEWLKSIFTGIPPLAPPPPKPEAYFGYPPGKFDSIKDLGVFPVIYKGRIYHWLELFECRGLQ
jgi:4-amino-4-deoxy-L-arabinose transferase-like glycosyltransferase/membrane-associated phospholipid phosphatase